MDRRDFLKGALALPAIFSIPILLPTTPAIADDQEATPSLTDGPFYKPDSPQRTVLIESGIAGTKIVLTGTVFAQDGKALQNVLLDFWHADQNGHYDMAGYRLRGHQFTNGQGHYQLETIVPAGYSGRTRHIHVRVQASGSSILSTQLFFPGDPNNKTDFLFREELLMKMSGSAEQKTARFDFVLNA